MLLWVRHLEPESYTCPTRLHAGLSCPLEKMKLNEMKKKKKPKLMYLWFFLLFFSCCTEFIPITDFSVQPDPHFYALLCTAVGVHPSTGSFWQHVGSHQKRADL